MSWAQNLVPNSSFEQYTDCPNGQGQISYAAPWYSAWGTVNYYDSCSIGNYNVPNGLGGGGVANTGAAYTGMGVYVPVSGFENAREFAEVELVSQLISGEKYQVEFHVSLADSAWYAISNMSACLTANGIGNNLNTIFGLTPQIQNLDTLFLDKKNEWMKISGSFYADGTERYIAVGNFRNDQYTDTMFVYQGQSNWKQAHYYLDDVSVILDTTTGINEEEQIRFEIYPNPTREQLTIETQINKKTTFCLYDVTGKIVLYSHLTPSKSTVDVSQFPAGVYIGALLKDEAIISRRKIIIE